MKVGAHIRKVGAKMVKVKAHDRPNRVVSPVSSCIRRVSFDRDTNNMAVNIRGAVYNYPGETDSRFERFSTAPSAGRFYNKNVRLR